jgi:flagellin
MAVINTNMSAMVAQTALGKNERMMSKAMEQLSTGKRINSAADDAAGLAMVSTITSQVKGLSQAIKNANDGISVLQTADGAYAEVENILQRMRELAVQSSNDTLNDTQRGYLNSEFTQLASQIDTIGQSTKFNGDNLLDGGFSTDGQVDFKIGASVDQTVSVSLATLSGATVESVVVAGTKTPGGDTANEVVTFAEADVLAGEVTDITDIVSGSLMVNGEVVQLDFTTAADGGLTLTAVNGAAVTGGTGSFTLGNNAAAGAITFAANDGDFSLTAANDGLGTLSVGALTLSDAKAGVYATVQNNSIATSGGASTAVTNIDSALATIQDARATVGAGMSRLTYAADVMAAESSSMLATRGRIEDTDYATATTELARTQIIQQAGTAMLAQANQLPQTVLSLLQ